MSVGRAAYTMVAGAGFPQASLKWGMNPMPGLLQGKNALILGVANRWSLAYAIAEAFRREGAAITLTYQGERQRATVEGLAGELGAERVLPCDVTQPADMDHLAGTLARDGHPLDAIVHSIAYAPREDLARPFLETSEPGFLVAHRVSAYSLVAISRVAAPFMTRGGSITTLTYLGSTRVVPNYNVMGVAKAALEACVRYLASELGPRAIRVNAISAGPIKTASARAIKDFSSILDAVAERAPLRRNAEPGEVADAAVFLASELGRGVTGNILFVDAGYQIMGL
ncbi:MAG: enoyl-ACP reductase FabI [Bryobacteraceae bacterium]